VALSRNLYKATITFMLMTSYNEIIEHLRPIVFKGNDIMDWRGDDMETFNYIKTTLDNANLTHYFKNYDDEFPSTSNSTCVFLENEVGELIRLTKTNGPFLHRTASITPGTNIANGKRGDKRPLEIKINDKTYIGNSYAWDDVTCFKAQNQ
jgi:hypothetical protein